MTKLTIVENLNNSILKPLFASPALLRAFMLITTVFVLFHISTVFFSSSEVRLNYSSVFGVVTGNTYMSVLLFLCYLIWGNKRGKNRMRFAVIAFLVLIIVFYFITLKNGSVFPENRKEFVGFSWAVLFPLFWIQMLLFSTKVKRYCMNIVEKN
jgi:hypothetical protein